MTRREERRERFLAPFVGAALGAMTATVLLRLIEALWRTVTH